MNWSFEAVSTALQGHLLDRAPSSGYTAIRRVQTDSREVGEGDIFVCLIGERFDAHDFAAQVKSSGASGLITNRRLNVDIAQWVVKDTRLALGALSHAWRMQFDIPVLAVVGSNGKTTTKEMLGAMCKAQCGAEHVLVTAGNLNNDIGVPQTLLKLRAQHRMAVIEMGMNHPGEIDYLAGLVKPRVAVLTNAQREHQEFMKSVEAVAQENGSVFSHLQPGGGAVIPANTEFDSLWADQSTADNLMRFGAGADFDLIMPGRGNAQAQSLLRMPGGEYWLTTSFLGQHNANNAAAAAAAAFSAGCSAEAICKGLQAFKPVSGRLQVVFNTPSLVLVNDTYNANPDSVNAASEVLAGLPGHTLMILGDMGEVGDQSEAYHREVGAHAKQAGVKHLFALGDATVHSVDGFGDGAQHFKNIQNLIEFTMKTLQQGSWSVLVKGSRFMKMERVVDALMMAQSTKMEGHHAS
ncbi:MAG TPA: UDP-N-acetylmuramoyl-tripeptide--D-alanyl-D-alanine ligase [Limnobacter sp.]|nr:UDP-N-acetylmuramoyl-tripeptide--D-alanyl-D-alanine ligase [Limnobacter sp.]